MSILIPFSYILLGYILGKFWNKASLYFSFLLVNVFIPIVILITIISYTGDVLNIIFLSITFSLLMYIIGSIMYSQAQNKNIKALCFSYYNIGWLGLPLSIYFFGPEVVPVMISAYIGGMLFGTCLGIYALNKTEDTSVFTSLKKLFLALPFLAFITSLVIKYSFGNIDLEHQYPQIYGLSKLGMSFLGMSILGIWLEKNPLRKDYLKENIVFSMYRFIVGFCLFLTLAYMAYYLELITMQELKYLMIIPFLPIAANITVLESYYLKSANSLHATIISTVFSLIILLLVSLII